MYPIAFRLGLLTVRWYGVAYAVVLLVALTVLYGESKRKELRLDLPDLIDFVLIAFPLGIIGARVYYALFNLEYFLDHPLLLFGGEENVEFGLAGLAIHGGLIGGYLDW